MPARLKRVTAISSAAGDVTRVSKRQKPTKKREVPVQPPAIVNDHDRSHKRKDKNVLAELKKDVFDLSKPIDIETAKCALCKLGHEFGVKMTEYMKEYSTEGKLDLLHIDPLQDIEAVWVSRYSLMHKGRLIFVHCLCAEMSQQAYKAGDDNCWYNVALEIARGSRFNCDSCGKKGATVGCVVPRCTYNLHVPCALKHGMGKFLLHKKHDIYCDRHHGIEKEKEAKKDLLEARDVAKGNELIPIIAANELDSAVLSTEGFEYTARNIDSDEVDSSQPQLLNLQCCDCEGLCDDPARCRCLQWGQNYTHTGLLIPDNQINDKRRILECNFLCSCSVRRCNNRVVEKGLTARLEIFRVRRDEYFLSNLQQQQQQQQQEGDLREEQELIAATSSSVLAATTAVATVVEERVDAVNSEEEEEEDVVNSSSELVSVNNSNDNMSDHNSNSEPTESSYSSEDNSDEDASAAVVRKSKRPQRSGKQHQQQQQQLSRLRRNSSSKSAATSAVDEAKASVDASTNTNTFTSAAQCSASSKARRSTAAKAAGALNTTATAVATDKVAAASSVDSQGVLSEQLTWGVRTLDFIPQNSFVCEIAGQYIEGRSNPSFSTWDRRLFGGVEASELVLEYCLMCANQKQQQQQQHHQWGPSVGDLRRIFPVEMWGSQDDAAGFFVQKLNLRERDTNLTSFSSAKATSASVLGATSSASCSAAAAISNGTATSNSDLLLRYSSDIKEHLRDQILIDSRFYGNVGSFIRRYQDVAAAVATRRNSPLLNKSVSFNYTKLKKLGNANKAIEPIQNMLLRRVVYSSDNMDSRNPKLALFAAQDIPAGTELLL